MKNQLLILVLLIFACDTTGRSSVSSNVVYEKYVLDCNDPEATVEIDVSDYPVITYYQVRDGLISSSNQKEPLAEILSSTGGIISFGCYNEEPLDVQIVASVFRPS